LTIKSFKGSIFISQLRVHPDPSRISRKQCIYRLGFPIKAITFLLDCYRRKHYAGYFASRAVWKQNRQQDWQSYRKKNFAVTRTTVAMTDSFGVREPGETPPCAGQPLSELRWLKGPGQTKQRVQILLRP